MEKLAGLEGGRAGVLVWGCPRIVLALFSICPRIIDCVVWATRGGGCGGMYQGGRGSGVGKGVESEIKNRLLE